MNREIAPLKPADNAVIVDSTEFTLEESISALKSIVMGVLEEREV